MYFGFFFKVDLCLAVSFQRSRRELSIDMSEHRSVLKNNRKAYYPVLVLHPKQVQRLPKRVFTLINYYFLFTMNIHLTLKYG